MDSYSLAFSLSNIGPKRFQLLLNHFETVEKAWDGSKEDYGQIGIVGKTWDTFEKFRTTCDIPHYIEALEKKNVTFISFFDKRYPNDLKKLENPPIGLYCLGNISLLKNKSCIAIVGTRKITEYGRSVTEQIAGDLSGSGMCIVSGLALGVDGVSHRAALDSNGITIAVLACGVDCCTPSENYSLYKRILDGNGLIISEYPLSLPPNKGTFLMRNRIVAALSDGILVTEAAEDSGSLVTADWGFKLEKKVFAVPGPINSQMAQGSLKLLKQGAHLVTNAEDILHEFSISNLQFSNKIKISKLKLSKEEKKIVSLLESDEMTIDEIAKKLKIDVSKLFISVSNLEIKGLVRNRNGKFALIT